MTRWWKKDNFFATYRWSSKRKTHIEMNTKVRQIERGIDREID